MLYVFWHAPAFALLRTMSAQHATTPTLSENMIFNIDYDNPPEFSYLRHDYTCFMTTIFCTQLRILHTADSCLTAFYCSRASCDLFRNGHKNRGECLP